MLVPVGRMTSATVTATTAFRATHNWPEAPDSVAYLRPPHRHVFGVQVTVHAHVDDRREVEFHILQRHVDKVVSALCDSDELKACPHLEGWSCESIAGFVGEQLRTSPFLYAVYSVRVDEDGENWATVYWP
jgi:hypothetical protein